MYEESKKYAEYIQDYFSGLRKDVEVAVFPILTEDNSYSIKVHAIDLIHKRSAIFTAFVPEETKWQFSLSVVKSRANRAFGYTVFF